MSKELYWLTLTAAMTALFWVPYILDRIMVRGVVGATANPSPNDKPQSPWAERMMAAHTNAVENLVVFVPLVLVTHQVNITALTQGGVFPRSGELIAVLRKNPHVTDWASYLASGGEVVGL